MRDIAEYLAKAEQFDRLTADAPNDALKKRYKDLADCYRLLAAERERLIAEGAIPPKPAPPPPSEPPH